MRVVRTALANMSRMHSNEEEAMTRYALPCGAVQEIEMHKNGRRGRRRSHSVCKRERERERERESRARERMRALHDGVEALSVLSSHAWRGGCGNHTEGRAAPAC